MQKYIGMLLVLVSAVQVLAQQTDFGGTIQGTETPGFHSYKNWVRNPDFEKPASGVPVGVTASGGTVTRTTTSPIKGKGSLQFDASSASQTMDVQVYSWSADGTVANKSCVAKFSYSGDASLYDVRVRQGSSDVTLPQTLGNVSEPTPMDIYFPCGDGSNDTVVRFTSTGNGAAFKTDDFFVGLYEVTVSQAQVYGTITWNSANCAWSTTSTSYNAPTDADCSPVATGRVSIPGTTKPGFLLNNAPAGKYVVVISGNGGVADNTANGSYSSYRLNEINSATILDVKSARSLTNSPFIGFVLQGEYNISSVSNLAFDVEFKTSAGTNAANLAGGPELYLKAIVYWYPPSSAQAIPQSASGWFVDAIIDGAAADLGTTNVSVYTSIANSGLTMTPRSGSAPVSIPCSSTNAPATPTTGTSTCAAGNENLGVSFFPPVAGYYEVCATGAHQMNADSGIAVSALFNLAETPTNAQTITNSGNLQLISAYGSATATGLVNGFIRNSIKVCSLFNFSDTTQKVIRLMYAQAVTGTPDASNIPMSPGQQNVWFTVRPMNELKNTPIFAASINRDSTLRNEGMSGRNTMDWGNWSPTPVSVANIASVSMGASRYVRIGNLVIVSWILNIDPTSAAVLTQVGIPLPVASDFTSNGDATGNCTGGQAATDGGAGHLSASTSADYIIISITPSSANNVAYRCMGMYEVK